MAKNTTILFPATTAVVRFVFSRRMVYTLLVAATVTTAAWQIENHRGRQRWTDVSAQLALTSDDLTAASCLPLPVPDELNATRHPALAPAMVVSDNRSGFGYSVQFSELLTLATTGIPEDFDTADPHTILTATAPFGDYMAQLHQAFQRPHCHWFTYQPEPETSPHDQPVPAISSLPTLLAEFLDLSQLRTRALLALGDTTTATRELVALIQLARSTSHDSSLVGALVETTTLKLMLKPLAGLIATPGWDDESLATIADAFAGIRLLEKIELALRGERNACLEFMLNQNYLGQLRDEENHNFISAAAATYAPRGWVYQNAANLVTWWDDCITPYYDSASGRVDPGPHPSLAAHLSAPLTPYTVFAVNVACPNLGSIYQQLAATQSSAALLQLLCAIERHHLEHGQRPASLTKLAPHYITSIPLDPITNLTPHYTHDETGNLTLATLDWDQTGNPATYDAVINLTVPATSAALTATSH